MGLIISVQLCSSPMHRRCIVHAAGDTAAHAVTREGAAEEWRRGVAAARRGQRAQRRVGVAAQRGAALERCRIKACGACPLPPRYRGPGTPSSPGHQGVQGRPSGVTLLILRSPRNVGPYMSFRLGSVTSGLKGCDYIAFGRCLANV